MLQLASSEIHTQLQSSSILWLKIRYLRASKHVFLKYPAIECLDKVLSQGPHQP